MGTRGTEKRIKQLTDKQFPRQEYSTFIVTPSTPLLDGLVAHTLEVIEDATISAVTDSAMHPDSAVHPTVFVAGHVTYGSYIELEISAGIIKAYLV